MQLPQAVKYFGLQFWVHIVAATNKNKEESNNKISIKLMCKFIRIKNPFEISFCNAYCQFYSYANKSIICLHAQDLNIYLIAYKFYSQF